MASITSRGARGAASAAGCAFFALTLVACTAKTPPASGPGADGAKLESANDFIKRVSYELEQLDNEAEAAGWTQATYITRDTEMLSAKAYERYLAYLSKAVEESKRYDGQQLSPATARAIALLKLNVAAPAPPDPKKRAELTQLASRLEAMYGEGKYCPDGPGSCKTLDDLSETLAKSRQYDELTEAWKGWHDVAGPMREPYQRFVALANEGARSLGYKDLGVMWRAGYDMTPEQFDQESERLWQQVKPLYEPGHLAQIGLVSNTKPSAHAVINQQMKMALEKIAFLPFGRLIDQWRWKVFSGEITPENYNKAWWEMRRQYQGIAPPVERTEANFDAGAKYHIPANTPYTRYFLSYLIQFQFHKALCDAAGFKGPLNECSVYGNKAAGERFAKMLSLGASQPWQDTLEELTGSRQMDAAVIIEYFKPLMTWLKTENEGAQCGWES